MENGRPTPEIDLTVPNVARMYDYYLGGKDNFEVDRRARRDNVRRLAGLRRRHRGEVSVFCAHDRDELEQAARVCADFVVLGPIAATPSHPRARTLGWARFSELIGDCPLPVFALGGMRTSDCLAAWRAGAHGIAMLRGAWE